MLKCMDLSRQYAQNKRAFMDAIEMVCDENAFSDGKYVKKFEEEFAKYIGVNYCSCVGSGTDALFLALKALGIKEGDEVIVPADTFIASAWGCAYIGAKPVFVEIDPDTWEIDYRKIEEKITDRTKAIIGVHLYGCPFDFDKVSEIAKAHGLYIIEDACQAHGSEYKGKKAGSLADMSCFSFYPGKNLGAFGEAGAVLCNKKDLYEKVEMLKNHGSEERYKHDIIGYNMRMDGIQGAILSEKLKHLDEWNRKRNAIADSYKEGIKNDRIKIQTINPEDQSNYHLFEIEVDDVDAFMSYMEDNSVLCARHYPISCHLQKAFEYLGYKPGDLPVSEYHADHCVSLPLFPEMTMEEADLVIDLINAYKH